MAYYVPRLKKWGGHVPPVPHQIAPMFMCMMWLFAVTQQEMWLFGVTHFVIWTCGS